MPELIMVSSFPINLNYNKALIILKPFYKPDLDLNNKFPNVVNVNYLDEC